MPYVRQRIGRTVVVRYGLVFEVFNVSANVFGGLGGLVHFVFQVFDVFIVFLQRQTNFLLEIINKLQNPIKFSTRSTNSGTGMGEKRKMMNRVKERGVHGPRNQGKRARCLQF